MAAPTALAAPPADRPSQATSAPARPENPGNSGNPGNSSGSNGAGNAGNAGTGGAANNASNPSSSGNSGNSGNPGNSSGQGAGGSSESPGNSGNAGNGNQGVSGERPSNPAANPNSNAGAQTARPTEESGSRGNRPETAPGTAPQSAQGSQANARRIPAAALAAPGRSALQRALDVDLDGLDADEQANDLAVRACLSEKAEAQERANIKRKAAGKTVRENPSSWAPGRVRQLELECEEEVGDTGDYIVVFTPGAAASDRAEEAREQSARRPENRIQVKKVYENVFPGALIKAGAKQIEALRKNPNVQLVEPDGLAQSIAVQNPAPWGVDRIDQRALPLDGDYSYTSTGSGVDAYIVDTGIRSDHQDFSGRVQSGYTAIVDGNGTEDCNGHGTHVAGTVAGSTYGVAKDASLIPVRVLGCTGSGTWSGVIAGLDYIAGRHAAGTPAVANMSLGGGASSSVDLAVRNLVADGVSVIVAAGNSATDACSSSPAREPSAITVAASDASDAQAYFSNYGSCVDIYAPGVGITSAWYTSPSATASLSGTSMATPHVAGAAARVLQNAPGASPDATWATLRDLATPGALIGLGTGSPDRLLFVPSEVTEPPVDDPQDPVATVPEAPTSVVASAGVRAATVRWTLPPDGGSPITSLYVYVYDERGSLRGTVQVSGSTTQVQITDLRPRKPYTFRVSAVNLVGQGALSEASAPVTATNR